MGKVDQAVDCAVYRTTKARTSVLTREWNLPGKGFLTLCVDFVKNAVEILEQIL